jgi:hypothetical protein
MQSLAWAASRCVTAWGLLRSANKKPGHRELFRHSRESGNPGRTHVISKGWVAAFAGMTNVSLMHGNTTAFSIQGGSADGRCELAMTMASNDRRYSAASAIDIVGRRLRVPTAISYACPAWNSVASMNGLAINCIDTGSPPAPNPVHTLIAG